MPVLGSTSARKICVLPFYVDECVRTYKAVINTGVAASSYPHLVGEYGRIFDILLFMQAKCVSPVVTFSPPPIVWYKI